MYEGRSSEVKFVKIKCSYSCKKIENQGVINTDSMSRVMMMTLKLKSMMKLQKLFYICIIKEKHENTLFP